MSPAIDDAPLSADVRRHDYDRYLCTLFAPRERRADLIALLAFNLELSRLRERVTELTLGQIRLTWWHETIEGVFDGHPRQHPVAQSLARMVGHYGLSRRMFEEMIDSRTKEFDETGFANLGELESFAEQTSGALQCVSLKVLEVDETEAVEAARRVGLAWALVGLCRSVPYHARLGRVYLPRDLLASADLAPSAVAAMRDGSRLEPVIEAVLELAAEHLTAARRLKPNVPPGALPVLLPATLATSYLRDLSVRKFDPFAIPGEANPTLRQLRLIWASWTKRY